MSAAMVPLVDLHAIWTDVWPMLQPAVESSPDKPDVLAELYAGRADLWAIREDGKPIAAIVTTKQPDSSCLIWLVGGSRLREWAPSFMAVLIDAARAAGCWRIWGASSCRRGWHRVVPLFGGARCADHDGYPAWEFQLEGTHG